MKKSNVVHSMMAVVLGTALISGNAMADTTSTMDHAASSAGAEMHNSMHNHMMGDRAITKSIKAKLRTDHNVPWRKIKVETKNGEVWLTGHVKHKSQSERAESIATGVEGVKSVKNYLRVKH